MAHLIKNFIYINNNDDSHELFIYNFQQTSELETFPYNQWIVDKPESERSLKISGTRTKTWIKQIYLNFIKPEFESRTLKFQLMYLTEMIGKCSKVVGKEVFTDKEMKPITNFERDISTIFDNIISFVQTGYQKIPK